MALIDILEKERTIEKEIRHIDKKIKHQKYICERWADEVLPEAKISMKKEMDILTKQRENLIESLRKHRIKMSMLIRNIQGGRY